MSRAYKYYDDTRYITKLSQWMTRRMTGKPGSFVSYSSGKWWNDGHRTTYD